jgi:hypothetical protein
MSVQAWLRPLEGALASVRFTTLRGTGYLLLITTADNEGQNGQRAERDRP